MKYTYTDLLGKTKEVLDAQPQDVKDAILIISEYQDSAEEIAMVQSIETREYQYRTYTHN